MTPGMDFVRAYGGQRFAAYAPQPPLWGEPEAEDVWEESELDYEIDPEDWTPITIELPPSWRAREWEGCPVRFIDGKDEGETITSLTSPDGHPVPVRLSEIGGIEVEVRNGECRRAYHAVERVVSMVADVFPSDEVEAFFVALQDAGLRLLFARPPREGPPYDLEKMRKAAQNRSNDEMGVLETAALMARTDLPTVVDGRLEPRLGGPEQAEWPVFGVIKKHHKNYLHPLGMQILYRLQPGQRTPAFSLPQEKLPVVTWYVRLAGGPGTMPNWGLVRIEASQRWFERTGQDWSMIDRLSRVIHDYRCRERSYGRAPVSLHPIVRAEELLGALFTPPSALASRFYRLVGL
jgi:hypothetical protein